MDMVVVEIDLKNYRVSLASAMSSAIIYKGSEQIYIRGTNTPIGGPYNVNVKSFDDRHFELAKGDRINIYSGGYNKLLP
jgi:hypothetical protein